MVCVDCHKTFDRFRTRFETYADDIPTHATERRTCNVAHTFALVSDSMTVHTIFFQQPAFPAATLSSGIRHRFRPRGTIGLIPKNVYFIGGRAQVVTTIATRHHSARTDIRSAEA
jgi:hypothetical protein